MIVKLEIFILWMTWIKFHNRSCPSLFHLEAKTEAQAEAEMLKSLLWQMSNPMTSGKSTRYHKFVKIMTSFSDTGFRTAEMLEQDRFFQTLLNDEIIWAIGYLIHYRRTRQHNCVDEWPQSQENLYPWRCYDLVETILQFIPDETRTPDKVTDKSFDLAQ